MAEDRADCCAGESSEGKSRIKLSVGGKDELREPSVMDRRGRRSYSNPQRCRSHFFR